MLMNHTNLTGTWRSYRAFSANGSVKKFSDTSYLEVHRDAEGTLLLKLYADRPLLTEVPDGGWAIQEESRRPYLFLLGRRAFEVLTLDKHDLVLADPVKGEKIFFAPLKDWKARLNPELRTAPADVSITIWSKSLAALVKK